MELISFSLFAAVLQRRSGCQVIWTDIPRIDRSVGRCKKNKNSS